jgi:hypothetical protein
MLDEPPIRTMRHAFDRLCAGFVKQPLVKRDAQFGA